MCRILGAHDKDDAQEIAAAYEKKYDTPLKADLAKHCKGNYKRLAVAWIDLPDQLEQPTKTIKLSVDEELEDAAARGSVVLADNSGDHDDDLDDDDDEDPDSIPPPDSPLYRTKANPHERPSPPWAYDVMMI